MKIKLNHIIRSFVFILFISLTSCEKELYEDSIQNSSRNLTVQHIKLNDIDKAISTKIENKISAIKKTKELKDNVDWVENRFEYNSTLDIYIDTENGKLVNDNGKVSYTFPMFRESEEKLENIIFSPLINGEIETFFVKYNVKLEDFKNLTSSEIQNLIPIFQKITVDSPEYVCIDFIETITLYGACNVVHSNGQMCTGETSTFITSFCNWTTSNGTGGGGDPISGTYGNYGSGNQSSGGHGGVVNNGIGGFSGTNNTSVATVPLANQSQ